MIKYFKQMIANFNERRKMSNMLVAVQSKTESKKYKVKLTEREIKLLRAAALTGIRTENDIYILSKLRFLAHKMKWALRDLDS